jgi:hypothetical protein
VFAAAPRISPPKFSYIALAEIYPPIQHRRVNNAGGWFRVVVEESINVIEPCAFGSLRCLHVCNALDVPFAHEARRFRRLLGRGAELRLDELWQPLEEECVVDQDGDAPNSRTRAPEKGSVREPAVAIRSQPVVLSHCKKIEGRWMKRRQPSWLLRRKPVPYFCH